MSLTDTNSLTSDWAELLHQALDPTISDSQIFQSFSDSIVVTTEPSPTTSLSPKGRIEKSSKPSPTTSLSPKGRIEKSSKRRTRASRRAPTTLLNTDYTNFRAMVQQFTGISGYQPTSRPFINFVGNRPAVEPFSHPQQQQQQYQAQPLYQPLDNFTEERNRVDNFLEGFSSIPRANVESGREGFLSDGQTMALLNSMTDGYFQNWQGV